MGLWEAHQKFGKLPWAELLTPAVGYAKNGFKIAAKQYQYREDARGAVQGQHQLQRLFRQHEGGRDLQAARAGADHWSALPTGV